MSKIDDLPTLDKPREKAARFGIETLSDEELLALIINNGTVGHSSLDIARDVLNDAHTLSALYNKPYQYFHTFKGLKKVNALRLAATIEIAKRMNEKTRLVYEEKAEITSDSLYQRYSLSLAGLSQENCVLVILNKNKQIIFEKVLFKGNDNDIVLSTREIIHLLILHNGYYFYLSHNHPNGTPFPSETDVKFTEKMNKRAEKIGVKLLDHLIIGQNGYYSFLHSKVFS